MTEHDLVTLGYNILTLWPKSTNIIQTNLSSHFWLRMVID